MRVLILILSTLLICSCASVRDLEQAKDCQVWKDNPLFLPPTAVSAGNGRASWSGHCRTLWWDCKNVSGNLEKNGDVFVSTYHDYKLNWDENKPIGKIENGIFRFNEENVLLNLASIGPRTADMKDLTVKYNVKFFGMDNDVAVRFNKACTAEDALVGSLVLATVEKVNSEAAHKH